jgi:hypothetical protein
MHPIDFLPTLLTWVQTHPDEAMSLAEQLLHLQ